MQCKYFSEISQTKRFLLKFIPKQTEKIIFYFEKALATSDVTSIKAHYIYYLIKIGKKSILDYEGTTIQNANYIAMRIFLYHHDRNNDFKAIQINNNRISRQLLDYHCYVLKYTNDINSFIQTLSPCKQIINFKILGILTWQEWNSNFDKNVQENHILCYVFHQLFRKIEYQNISNFEIEVKFTDKKGVIGSIVYGLFIEKILGNHKRAKKVILFLNIDIISNIFQMNMIFYLH